MGVKSKDFFFLWMKEAEFVLYQIDSDIVHDPAIRIDAQRHAIGQIQDASRNRCKYSLI